jgi:transposase
VTMTLVWQEYLQAHPSGYRYSRFVEMYREWEGKHTYSMVQHHHPGEKLFVDSKGLLTSDGFSVLRGYRVALGRLSRALVGRV